MVSSCKTNRHQILYLVAQVADRRPHSAAITPMRGALSTSMGTPGSGDRVIAVDNVKNTDKTREDSD